jgi:hypothetical protein
MQWKMYTHQVSIAATSHVFMPVAQCKLRHHALSVK